jgi:hypothetical protein
MGCPVLSAGPEAYLAELLLIHAYPSVLKFIREVATTEDFRNPRYEVDEAPPEPDHTRYWTGFTDKEDNKVKNEAAGADGQKNLAGDGKADVANAPENSTKNEQKTQQPHGDKPGAALEDWTYPAATDDEADDLREWERREGPNRMIVPDTGIPDVSSSKVEVAKQSDGEEPAAVNEKAAHIPEQKPETPTLNEHEANKSSPNEEQVTPSKPGTGSIEETDVLRGANEPLRRPADDRHLRERVHDLGKMMDERAKEAAALQKKEDEEKAKLEFMRREVLHTIEQIESMAARTLEEGGRVGAGSDEDDDEEEEDDDE